MDPLHDTRSAHTAALLSQRALPPEDTAHGLLLFKQNLLLCSERKGLRDQNPTAVRNKKHLCGSVVRLWLDQAEAFPVLTVHSLPTRTGCRSAGPCSEQSSRPLPDVTLSPHNVPAQKGWWKVLQRPNSTERGKHHHTGGHTSGTPSQRQGTLGPLGSQRHVVPCSTLCRCASQNCTGESGFY